MFRSRMLLALCEDARLVRMSACFVLNLSKTRMGQHGQQGPCTPVSLCVLSCTLGNSQVWLRSSRLVPRRLDWAACMGASGLSFAGLQASIGTQSDALQGLIEDLHCWFSSSCQPASARPAYSGGAHLVHGLACMGAWPGLHLGCAPGAWPGLYWGCTHGAWPGLYRCMAWPTLGVRTWCMAWPLLGVHTWCMAWPVWVHGPAFTGGAHLVHGLWPIWVHGPANTWGAHLVHGPAYTGGAHMMHGLAYTRSAHMVHGPAYTGGAHMVHGHGDHARARRVLLPLCAPSLFACVQESRQMRRAACTGGAHLMHGQGDHAGVIVRAQHCVRLAAAGLAVRKDAHLVSVERALRVCV